MSEENIKIIIEFDVKDKEIVDDDTPSDDVKLNKELEDTVDSVEEFKVGNVGDIQNFTSSQFGNIKGFAASPFKFMIGTVFKKFGKGLGIAALVVIFFELIKFIIFQLMEPGRLLDTRFKKLIDKQILVFTDRKEQAELRQGFKEVRITTIGGLRGGEGQVGGNFFTPNRISQTYLDSRKLPSSIVGQDSRLRNKFGQGSVGSRGSFSSR